MYVLRNNLLWVFLAFAVCAMLAFLVLRYTNPVYVSRSEIQLTNDESASSIFRDEMAAYPNENLAKEIELLRSPLFLNRVVRKLPLDVSYYNDGRFLDHEAYGSNLFHADYHIRDNSAYGVKYKVQMTGTGSFDIENDATREKRSSRFGDTISFTAADLVLSPKGASIPDDQGEYYFVINDSNALVRTIQSKLSVTILNQAAKTIEISYSDNNKYKCSDIVNVIAKEFETFNIEKKQDGANKIISYIDRALVLVTDKLTATDKELSENFDDTEINPFFAEKKTDIESQKIARYQDETLRLESDLEALNELKGRTIENRNDLIEIQAIIAGTSLEKYLSTYLSSIQTSFSRREELRYSAPAGSPLLSGINYTIDNQVKAFENSLEAVHKLTKRRYAELDSITKRSKENIPWFKDSDDTTNIDLSKLKRQRSVNEKYFNQLVEKRAEMEFLREGTTPEYQVLAFGQIPSDPRFPNKRNIILLALGIWVAFSLGLLTLRYIFQDEILSPDEISKYTEAHVLGVVHRYNESIPVSQLVVNKNPKGLIAEAFRSIRTNMAFLDSEKGKKIISITSTISGEGKTFVAINLSGIIAYSNAKVIVIDCDMRKPKIHVGFEAQNNRGMSTLLTNQNTLEECIQHSKMGNLDFITAGPPPPNPAELLISPAMDELIEELMSRYDYVVIDNPPAGIVSDSIVNMKRAHYPIYIVRSGYSRKFFINNINRLISDNEISKLSVIVNGVDFSNRASYGMSNSSYGYGVYTYGYGTGYNSEHGFGYYMDENSLSSYKDPILRRIFGRKKKK